MNKLFTILITILLLPVDIILIIILLCIFKIDQIINKNNCSNRKDCEHYNKETKKCPFDVGYNCRYGK